MFFLFYEKLASWPEILQIFDKTRFLAGKNTDSDENLASWLEKLQNFNKNHENH